MLAPFPYPLLCSTTPPPSPFSCTRPPPPPLSQGLLLDEGRRFVFYLDPDLQRAAIEAQDSGHQV